jgi:hypothetical protein
MLAAQCLTHAVVVVCESAAVPNDVTLLFFFVLWVVARQIIVIQRAMAAGVSSFLFEGSKIRLKTSTCVFITMNPKYAGRQELPDNLKVCPGDVHCTHALLAAIPVCIQPLTRWVLALLCTCVLFTLPAPGAVPIGGHDGA